MAKNFGLKRYIRMIFFTQMLTCHTIDLLKFHSIFNCIYDRNESGKPFIDTD